MSIQNNELKRKTLRAIDLQEENLFIVDQRSELPLPMDGSLERLSYSNERDEQGRYYDYQNSWGYFSLMTSKYLTMAGAAPFSMLAKRSMRAVSR